MPAKVRDMKRMLTGKLGAEEKEGGKHIKYKIAHEGKLLATTALSRGHDEIDNSLLREICKDLYVNRDQMDGLIQCPMSRDDYIRHRLNTPAK